MIVLDSMCFIDSVCLCGVSLTISLTSKYEIFNYDRSLVNTVTCCLRSFEKALADLNMKVECDEELTWIRFKKQSS